MSGAFRAAAPRFFRGPAVELGLPILLGPALAIPLLRVWALVEERRSRATSLGHEIGELWGGVQSLSGPVPAVPYPVRVVTKVDE
jgi:inner membrane protein involved in colicin E2 resistance